MGHVNAALTVNWTWQGREFIRQHCVGLTCEEQDNQCLGGRAIITATLLWTAGLNIRRLLV